MPSSIDDRSEILIIGAGIIGASVAFALAKAGHDVLVVDRGSGAGDGSTGASAGIIRVHATDAQSAALAADSLVAWNDWAGFLGADPEDHLARFVRCGSLILDAGDGFVERVSAAMGEADVAFERWTLPDVEDRFPYLDLHRFGPPRSIEEESFWDDPVDHLAGALYTPQSGYVSDPTLAAADLMRAAQRAGARLRLSTEVGRIDRVGARVTGVTLADGTSIGADVVIAAAGPHTHALLGTIGGTDDFTIRTRRIREELVHVPAPPGLDLATQGVHLVDGDLNINFRPDGGSALLGGSNGDLAEEQQAVDDPDVFERSVTADAFERMTVRLARRIPDLRIPRGRSGVVGLYDATEDWLPIYDRTRFDGLFVAMGTSGTQFKTAPVVGELVRHIVETEVAGRDHTSVPFRGPVGDREYATGQFSRLRAPATGQARG